MFNNVGKKLMVYAKVSFWIELIAGIIVGIVFFAQDEPGIGFAAIGGGFATIVGSWVIYAFGQMVDDIHEMKDKPPVTIPTPPSAPKPVPKPKPAVSDELPDL